MSTDPQLSSPSNLTVRSGGKDVLASGTVQTFTLEDLEFRLLDLLFKIKFTRNGSQPAMSWKPIDAKSLEIELANFENPLGTGTTSPLELGTAFNRKLYLAFLVHAPDSKTIKTFHYTFFLGEPHSG